MPRPVRQDRPATTEPVVEATQGSTILVLHPGSSTLQIGRVTDHYPVSVPHVIAHRINEGCKLSVPFEHPMHRDGAYQRESEEKRCRGYHAANQCLQAMRISGGYRKSKVLAQEIAAFNSQVCPTAAEVDGTMSWTDIRDKPKVLIGEQALSLQPNAPYIRKWPIRRGNLNIHDGVGGSASAVASDLELLWGMAIETHLDIPRDCLNFYRAVLLVPDIFESQHVKIMIDVLLNRLKFSCVIVNQESVCACLGAGLLSACVIDVGDQKTSVACVEDGVSLPSSRLTLNFGGSDITRCFLWLLQRSSFPYKSIDVDDTLDVQLLYELKETFCHLSFEIPAGNVHEFQVSRPQEQVLSYKLRLGDEPMQAPVSMFVPELLGIVGETLVRTFPEQTSYDYEDLMDDHYLLESKDREGRKGRLEADANSDTESSFVVPQPVAVTKKPGLASIIVEQLSDGLGIDQAILHCVEQSGGSETKRKMYSTLLLVGGGLDFKGADEFLLRRVKAQLPAQYQFLRDQMEIVTRPKENDPRSICWKGGTVVSFLDSAQELWISQKEWNRYGVRILRERCAFQWSSNTDKL